MKLLKMCLKDQRLSYKIVPQFIPVGSLITGGIEKENYTSLKRKP